MTQTGIIPLSAHSNVRLVSEPIRSAVGNTLLEIIEGFSKQSVRDPVAGFPHSETPRAVLDQAFSILTSRRFSYLGRSRAEAYRNSFFSCAGADVRRGHPIQFFYDIGPGYHASLRPGIEGLDFGIGLSELLLLSQVHAFNQELARVYHPGSQFHLVIDNVCGLETNDVPVRDTEVYRGKLRDLLRELGIQDRVGLLVESELPEVTSPSQSSRKTPPASSSVSETERENVERFLGQTCSDTEAIDRIARYRQAISRSERRLAPFIRGVRMTQRATDTTIGFRSFPGGDSRMQCGQVAFRPHPKGTLQPFLLTNRNFGEYRYHPLSFPGLLPVTIESVIYAEPLG